MKLPKIRKLNQAGFDHALVLVIFVALFAGVGVFALVDSRAATYPAFCNEAGDCVNSYGNNSYGSELYGTSLNTGNKNEYFYIQGLDLCKGADYVTSTCPFGNASIDKRYLGNEIFQIVDGSKTNLCLAYGQLSNGINGASGTMLGNCNNPSTGTGGSNDSVFVINTHSGTSNYVESRGFTNGLGSVQWLCDLNPPTSAYSPSTNNTIDNGVSPGTAKYCQWGLY